jgi:hypothetical protein
MKTSTIIWILLFSLLVAFLVMRTLFGWGLDDTDLDKWHRSGMTVYTDYKTGVQYLSNGFGTLTPRLGTDGKPLTNN